MGISYVVLVESGKGADRDSSVLYCGGERDKAYYDIKQDTYITKVVVQEWVNGNLMKSSHLDAEQKDFWVSDFDRISELESKVHETRQSLREAEKELAELKEFGNN